MSNEVFKLMAFGGREYCQGTNCVGIPSSCFQFMFFCITWLIYSCCAGQDLVDMMMYLFVGSAATIVAVARDSFQRAVARALHRQHSKY